jgi:hypothetical protein
VVEIYGEREEDEGAEEVGVDVDRFVVEVKKGSEGPLEGEGGGAVAGEDEVVISVREMS